MTNAQIKKPQGIEEVIGSYTPQAIETKQTQKTTENNKFKKLLIIYENLINIAEQIIRTHDPENLLEPDSSSLPNKAHVFSPFEINSFLQQTIQYEARSYYETYTGSFISKLIQNSYDNGNNDFILNTRNLKKINYLGSRLIGREEDPIKIIIIGNAGERCGHGAKNFEFKIDGNASDALGCWAANSKFKVKGNTSSNCGCYATNSEFSIHGSAGDDLGYKAEKSKFEVRGKTGELCGWLAKNSEFKTQNRHTLDQFLKYTSTGNKITHIHHDGTEEIMRDYYD